MRRSNYQLDMQVGLERELRTWAWVFFLSFFFFFYIYACGRSRNSKRKTITGGNPEGVIRQLGKELGEFRATKPRE